MPFDRLVQAVDDWAGQSGKKHEVLAQIGDTALVPRHLRHQRALAPDAFRQACVDADFIIGHAGMGTVLTAIDLQKPLLILPRRGDLQETRNDHQIATARWLAQRPGIWVALDPADLPALLDLLCNPNAGQRPASSGGASIGLISGLRQFLSAS